LETILKEHQFWGLDESMTQLLQQARRQGLEVSDINAVLLVGGTVQMPAVTWVQQFEPKKLVSVCAIKALSNSVKVSNFKIFYHSYGIRYWNHRHNRHSWHSKLGSLTR